MLNELFRSAGDDECNAKMSSIAASSSTLWQCADKIILLEQLTGDELKSLADKRLGEIAKRLNTDYGIELDCNDRYQHSSGRPAGCTSGIPGVWVHGIQWLTVSVKGGT